MKNAALAPEWHVSQQAWASFPSEEGNDTELLPGSCRNISPHRVRNDAGSKCQVQTCVSDGLTAFSWNAIRVLHFVSYVGLLAKSPLWCSMKNSLHAGECSNELKVWETSPVCRVNEGDRSLSPSCHGADRRCLRRFFFYFFYACLNASVPQCCRRWFTIGWPPAWVPESHAVNSWQFSGCATKCHFPPEMPHEGRSSMWLSL